MNWIEVNGIALRYELTGAGPATIVLIHEMGGSIESWEPLMPWLTDRFRVVRFDLRGAGLSEKIRGVLQIDQAAEDVRCLLSALGIPSPAVLCGCAVGAAIAIHAAASFPQLVSALIALAPACGLPPERRAEALAFADRLERDGVRATFGEKPPRSYPEELRQDSERYRAFRARQFCNDPEGYAATYRMLAQLEMDDDLSRIQCPALVVAGTLDQSRPPPVVEQVAKQIPGAQFKVLRTGHTMAYQTPELVGPLIVEFLARLPHARPGASKGAD